MNRMRTILAVAAIATAVQAAYACGYGMPSPAARLALADCVVVGKVTAVQKQELYLRQSAQGGLVPHVVQVLKLETVIKGDRRVTHIRVAVQKHQQMPIGHEACFFLREHSDEAVYVFSSVNFDYPIQKQNNAGFAKQMEQFKRMADLMADPVKGLNSKDADERFLTAALMITVFRTYEPEIHTLAGQMEPIDPELSRLILQTLADADWNRRAADFRLTAQRVFNELGVTQQDGWNPGATDRVAEAKRWLQENADSFEIKSFVRKPGL